MEFQLRIRDTINKMTFNETVTAKSLDDAILKSRENKIGWHYMYIMSITSREQSKTTSYFNFPQYRDFDNQGKRRAL